MHHLRAILLGALATLLVACGSKDSKDSKDSKEAAATRDVPQYAVEDLYRSNDFYGASFSPDKSRILVSTNLSGVFNAYVVPVAGGAPEPLTASTTNSIFARSYFPEDDRIIYSSDQGGNELSHIYVRNPDGKVEDLTPGEEHRATFEGWAGDDRSFYVTTNERDPRFLDVYEIAIDGYAKTLFYQNDEGFELGAISRDKRYVALLRINTTADTEIHLHDRTAGTTTNVTPHTGTVSNTPQTFTPDGTALLFTSDEGREFASLRRYDLASGSVSPVLEPAWDVTSATYSKSGKYLVVGVNEDSRVASHVYDAATLTEVPLTGMPPGIVQGLRFSRDDALFAFYSTDGATPSDLWGGEMGKVPQRLTDGLPSTIARENLVAPTMVRFASYDGVEIPGLLYRPHQVGPKSPAPALVLVHGGPGGQAQVNFSPLVQAMVNRGYVIYDINNRGSSGYGKTFFKMDDRKHGEADLGDVVAAKGMLAATGYVDSTRIGIIGGSYGGYMVLAALTLRPEEFQVGVDLFGISNWVRTLNSIPVYWESFRKALYDEMGDPTQDGERLHRISPLFNAEKIQAPLMVLQGANDPRVLQVESDEIVAAAKANGVSVEYIAFPDEGHGFLKKENEIRGTAAILAFLDRYLRGGATPGEQPAGE